MNEKLEKLIEEQKTIIKSINDIKKNWLPHGYCIDLDALDNVQIDKSGKQITSKELLEMLYKDGILITNNNSDAIRKIDGLSEFQLATLYNRLVSVTETIHHLQSING